MELAACRFNRLTLLFDHHLHTQLRPSVPHSVSLRHIVATCSYLVLQTLDVSQTTLQGPLPPEWGQPQAFPSLRILNASFTQLTGPLPSAWGSASAFQKLENMTFVGSGVSGGLPDSWGTPGAWPALKAIQIDQTGVSGMIARFGLQYALCKTVHRL